MCTVYHSLPYTLVVGVMKRLSELGHFWAPPRSATTTRADFLGPSCRPKGSPKRTHLPRKSGRRSRGERGKCWIPVLSTLSNGGTGVPQNGFINWKLYKMDDLEAPPILGHFFWETSIYNYPPNEHISKPVLLMDISQLHWDCEMDTSRDQANQ